MISDDLTVRSINMSAQHMFGYFSKEAVGSNIMVLFTKHYRRIFKAKVEEIMANTRPGDLEEVREGYPCCFIMVSMLSVRFYYLLQSRSRYFQYKND